jgi:endoplasmic reticulum Man9GlcNAc2 1,2-alpha-mannosidase
VSLSLADACGLFAVFILIAQTTIRVLGGLLSAYHLSGGDSLYLMRARDLADRMLPVFDTPSGLPRPLVNLQRRQGVWDQGNQRLVSTAEASTLQLEFRYLSELTDEDIYWKKAERVSSNLMTGCSCARNLCV